MTHESKVSSDILYHFTKDIDVVISILENGFYPRTSKEDLSVVLPGYDNRLERFNGIPMVCFTDIPLNLSAKHRTQYGGFGLGMSKDWARTKKLSPVFYMIKGSGAWEAYNHMQYVVVKELAAHNKMSIVIALIKLAGYVKPYGEDGIDKLFYDEREWRYLPPFQDTPDYCNWLLSDDLNAEKKDKLNRKMEKLYALKFSVDEDLKEIVIPKSTDERYVINKLRSSRLADPEALIRKIRRV